MQIDVEIVGLERLKKKYANLNLQVEKEIQTGLEFSGRRVEEFAKKSILRGQKTGRVYKVGSVLRKSSAAGEAPANQEGTLASSIRSERDKQKLTVKVAALAKKAGQARNYATDLEFGTIRMAARPFLFPALEKNKQWIANRMKKSMKDAIAKVKNNA